MAAGVEGTISVKKNTGNKKAFKAGSSSFNIALRQLPSDAQMEMGSRGEKTVGDFYYVPEKEKEQAAREGREPTATGAEKGYYNMSKEAAAFYAPSPIAPKSKKDIETDKVIVCWDTETTGLKAWEYKLLMATFWDLSEPKASMVTFADQDEEVLIGEIVDYVNAIDPDIMTGYNCPYDILSMASRALRFQVPFKKLYEVQFVDTMQWWQRGTYKTQMTAQKQPSLEDVAYYLFGEKKPYEIEACFEAYEKGDWQPFYIRNRWDVATEGDLFKAIAYIQENVEFEETPEALKYVAGTERQYAGTLDVQCKTCKQISVIDLAEKEPKCPICGSILSRSMAVSDEARRQG